MIAIKTEFAIKDISKVIIDDTEFNTIVGVKIFLKGDIVYLKIHNEVSDKYRFGKILNNIKELIANKKEHDVRLHIELVHDTGETTNEYISFKCKVANGTLLEINPYGIDDLGFTFEIMDIPDNEFIQQFNLLTKMRKARKDYEDSHIK